MTEDPDKPELEVVFVTVLIFAVLGGILTGAAVETVHKNARFGMLIGGLVILGGIVVCCLILCISSASYIHRKLNAVKREKRVVNAILERRGQSPDALARIAETAGSHETNLQVGVARGRTHDLSSAKRVGSINISENPPPNTVTPLFGTAQREVTESERDLLEATRSWSRAVEAYENAKSSGITARFVSRLLRLPDFDE